MSSNAPLTHRLLRQWESPPTWLGLFLGLAWAQSRFLPVLPSGPGLRIAGAVLILAGLVVFALALVEFRRHRTTVLPRETPQSFITGGIYRLSRNPIYLGDALILSGAALRWDAAALLLVPLFILIIRSRFILGEEAGLRMAFGSEFDAYASRVRRWL